MSPIPRCQVVPETGHQLSFQIDGREVLRWHQGFGLPRPCFYPVIGPSGVSLTRMGHPGAPDHDHHQSIWFAHHKVLGISFWNNSSPATIQQAHWFAYEDGQDECRMAVQLNWLDGHDPAPLLTQELICSLRPEVTAGEFTLELQSRFVPASASLEFQQTNFGFLAVRVARPISGFFGGGTLTGSGGRTGETQIFGQPCSWVDYSGENGIPDKPVSEGITYFDHPDNPGQPTGWHVREDGWMCASPTMNTGLVTTQQNPLTLRYLMLIHAGMADEDRNAVIHQEFSQRAAMQLQKSSRSHTVWQITRDSSSPAD
jgi:hypothetical protein